LPLAQQVEILRSVSVHAQSFIQSLGGAGRDPQNRYVNSAHSFFHTSFARRLREMNMAAHRDKTTFNVESRESFARIVTVLYRASKVTIDDWIPVIHALKIPPNSPILPMFESSLWQGFTYPLGYMSR
ncbi:MAG: hypothetical protein V4692_12720, partial [Bdellovibrionota bacterium]